MSPPQKNALTFRHKLGYGLGDAGGCMTFALMTGIFCLGSWAAFNTNS